MMIASSGRRRGIVILASILALLFMFASLAYASYEYNTARFIANPELLGIPTITITTRKPTFAIATPMPFVFDSGFEPLVVGTEVYQLTGDQSD